MTVRSIVVALLAGACLVPALAVAQQANNPLYRPAPKLPEPKYREQYSSMKDPRDLSGVWFIRDYNRRFRTPVNTLPPFTPFGKAEFDKRVKAEEAGTPYADASTHCWPHGIPRVMNSPYPIQIIHSPGKITIVHEVGHNIRQIRMDVPMPDKVPTSFLGYSVGHWEGDALVVKTTGLNGYTQVDEEGRPKSSAMTVTERYQKRAPDILEVTYTMDDPKTYTHPWTARAQFRWAPEFRMGEYICEENNRNKPDASGRLRRH